MTWLGLPVATMIMQIRVDQDDRQRSGDEGGHPQRQQGGRVGAPPPGDTDGRHSGDGGEANDAEPGQAYVERGVVAGRHSLSGPAVGMRRG
jgi:hypothetical protein